MMQQQEPGRPPPSGGAAFMNGPAPTGDWVASSFRLEVCGMRCDAKGAKTAMQAMAAALVLAIVVVILVVGGGPEDGHGSQCECMANGEENEDFCEGHGYSEGKCTGMDDSGDTSKQFRTRCHWGNCRGEPDFGEDDDTCECIAKAEKFVRRCEGHSLTQQQCLGLKGKGHASAHMCQWGWEGCVNPAPRSQRTGATRTSSPEPPPPPSPSPSLPQPPPPSLSPAAAKYTLKLGTWCAVPGDKLIARKSTAADEKAGVAACAAMCTGEPRCKSFNWQAATCYTWSSLGPASSSAKTTCGLWSGPPRGAQLRAPPAPEPVADTSTVTSTPIVWKAIKCATPRAGGGLVKTSCSIKGWDAGAISTKVAYGDIEVQFTASVKQYTMLGFSKHDLSGHYNDVECALYADHGTLRVYESGTKALDTELHYNTSSILAVRRRGQTIDFLRDGKVFATCGKLLKGRVFVDTSIYARGAGGVLSARWVGGKVIDDPESPIVWRGLSRCTKATSDGHLIKVCGDKAFDAGAVSARAAFGDATLQFSCGTMQHSFVGLTTNGNSDNHFKTIECAFHCDAGQLHIFEKGVDSYWQGPASYTAATELALRRKGNEVTFLRDGKRLKKCSVPLQGKMLADVSLHSAGLGGIHSSVWIGKVVRDQAPEEAVVWAEATCASVSGGGGQVLKAGCGNNWNGGAVSSQAATGDVELSFRCTTTQHSMIGFSAGSCNAHYGTIDCAFYCDRGSIKTYEKGAYKPVSKSSAPSYLQSSVLSVRRKGTAVQFLKDGKVLRTCGLKLSGKIVADVSLHAEGKGGIISAKWIGDVIPNPVVENPVTWIPNDCMATDEKTGRLVKTQCGTGWTGGAYSLKAAYGDASIRFSCSENQHSLIGFSTPTAAKKSHGYTAISCAMYCAKGNLVVYESGKKKFNGPSYKYNDILSVQRRGSTVTYLHNGKQFGPKCSTALRGKVLADASVYHDNGGGIVKAEWIDGMESVHRLEWDIAHPVMWTANHCAKADSKDGSLAKHGTCSDAWDAGAVSVDSFTKDVTLEVRCSKDQHTMVGFSKFDCSQHYFDIECALYCDRGNVVFYEHGSHKGKFGTYSEKTALRIVRKGDTVKFLKDGSEIKTCSTKMVGEIFADVSMYKGNKAGLLSAVWNPDLTDSSSALPPPPGPPGAPPPPPPQSARNPVQWRAMSCTQAGTKTGKLYKNGCGDSWAGGGISTNVATGDIDLEYRCSKDQHVHIGFTLFKGGNNDHHYSSIECAMYCNGGSLHAYERGKETWPGFSGAKYTSDSKLTLRRRGSKIEHLRDGKVLKKCSIPLRGALWIDASIFNQGQGGIEEAIWVGDISLPDHDVGQPVVWRGNSCTVSSAGGKLDKQKIGSGSGCKHGWNAGATSTKAAFSDVTLEFHCANNQNVMIGLSTGANEDNHFNQIDCAMYCNSQYIYVYEQGSKKLLDSKVKGGPKYTSDTTLALRRQGQEVIYLVNGKKIRTCGKHLNGEVFADISLHNAGGGGVTKARWIGSAKLPTVDHGHPISWQYMTGVTTTSSGSLSKRTKASGWNAGAISEYAYDGDVSIKFQCTFGTGKRQSVMVGMSAVSTNGHVNQGNHYKDLQCAIYCDGTPRTIKSYESGHQTRTGGLSAGGYTENTKLEIRRTGRNVLFIKDGKLFRTCSTELKGKVFADTSIYYHNTGGGLKNARWVRPMAQVDLDATASTAVQWQNFTCTQASHGGGLSKLPKAHTDCTSGWNAGALSTNSYSGDVVLQLRCSPGQYTMVGLSSSPKSNHKSGSGRFKDLVVAVYCNSGRVDIQEHGNRVAEAGNFNARSVFTISRKSTKVTLLQDGVEIYKYGLQLRGPVWADVTVHNVNSAGLLSAVWVKP